MDFTTLAVAAALAPASPPEMSPAIVTTGSPLEVGLGVGVCVGVGLGLAVDDGVGVGVGVALGPAGAVSTTSSGRPLEASRLANVAEPDPGVVSAMLTAPVVLTSAFASSDTQESLA